MSFIAEHSVTKQVSIREIQTKDLERVANLHRVLLYDEFIARLGNRFMETYYQAFAQSAHAVALVAEIDGRVVGALLGTLRPSLHYQWLVRRVGWKLCLEVLAHSILHPATGIAVLQTRLIRYTVGVVRQIRQVLLTSFVRRKPIGPLVCSQVADITHLFVDESVRGRRIGTALVDTYEMLARQKGVTRVDLVTLASNEGGAGLFYEKLGWTSCGPRLSRSGEQFVLYTKELTEPLALGLM